MTYVDDDHPNVPLSDWRAFVKDSSPYLDQVIERHECCLPDWFVPLARGVAVASDVLLRKASRSRGTYSWEPGRRVSLGPAAPLDRPDDYNRIGEAPIQHNVFECWVGDYECLLVRKLRNQLWTIETYNAASSFTDADTVLVHRFGSTPIVSRTLAQAELLAIHCWENQLLQLTGVTGPNLPSGLRWSGVCPLNHQVVIENARQRQIAEQSRP